MSSTTQVKDFSDLYTELLNKMKQPTSVTAITNQAKRYINSALMDMVFGFEYQMPWLERDTILRTHAPYSTGTVAISVGSTTLTGTSTLWNTADSYSENNARTTGKITLGGSDIYNVTTVTNDTSITLTQKYVGDAALSGSDYVYFEDEYALASDFLKPIDWRSFSSALNIPIIGRNEFRKRFPRPNISGRPKIAAVLDKPFSGSTTPVKQVQFFPYPDAAYNIPYSYITSNLAVSAAGTEAAQLSSDSDEPNLPYRYRHAIVLKAAEQWYRDRKDDARSGMCGQEYIDSVKRIVGDQPIGTAARAILAPRTGNYEGYTRKPYSRGYYGKRFSVNNSFDYFEDR